MMTTAYLAYGSRGILTLEEQSLTGLGRITPRLRFGFRADTSLNDSVTGRLLSLQLDVSFRDEFLGTGTLVPQYHTLSHHPAPIPQIDVPLSREAVAFLRDEVRDNDLTLSLKFSALFQITEGGPDVVGEPNGSPLALTMNSASSLTIPHSDWVRKVLKPLAGGDYILLTLHVPPPPADATWRTALSHLQAAEEAYLRGDDPSTLQRCYAAFESLRPHAPKTLFDAVTDLQKRTHLDRLLVESKGYMHAGRHVAKDGALVGEFDVDHRDSTFALTLTKTWMSYLSRFLD